MWSGFDHNICQITTEIFVNSVHLDMAVSLMYFIAGQIVVKIFSCFLQALNVMPSSNDLFFKFITSERDWKFIVIQVFNIRNCWKCFLDVVENIWT